MNYTYDLNSHELYHHGIKGQKWGVRRYQNPDGTLTDEGYRHYGYGKSRKTGFAPNTIEKIKKGAKIGGTVGAGIGAGMAGLSGAALIAGGAPLASVAALGAVQLASGTLSGIIDGVEIGAIVGAVTTYKGRKYIDNNPALQTKIKDFQRREFDV